MIKQIIKCLNENNKVSSWLVNEITTETNEEFYVIHKLETTRSTKTTEYQVTVYHEFSENDNKYLGSSTFILSHKLKKSEIEKKIEEAVYASSFIKNKEYKIVDNKTKKTFKQKENEIVGFELLNKIAEIFINETTQNVKFNSLELFYEKKTVHLINSNNVDLKKTINKTKVEAIPSYNGNEKVELYKMFEYQDVDLNKVKEDVKEAINDVICRYQASPIKDVKSIDVILRNDDAGAFFEDLISTYTYASVYRKANDKQINDLIQPNIKNDALTISLNKSCKANAFDQDGVIVKPTVIVKDGKLINYYGNNQYAYYINLTPTGNMGVVKVEKGKTSIEKMKKKPYLEIIALSGIQIEQYSHYIGGEVRLAIYFDGQNTYPVSGFSFSGNIDNCLETIILSKETVSTSTYDGPKYIKIKDMEIL